MEFSGNVTFEGGSCSKMRAFWSWSLLFSILMAGVLCRGERASDDDDEDRPTFVYQCHVGEILALYNRSIDSVVTECYAPVICGKLRNCVLTAGPECRSKFQYMSGLQEINGDKIFAFCCQVNEVQGDESCYDVNVVDRVIEGVVVASPSHPATKPKNPGVAGRSKRALPVFEQKAELKLLDGDGRRTPTEYVKGIHKIPHGYRVTVCTPHCSSTTSTTATRTPTTKKRTEKPTTTPRTENRSPEHKENAHRKSLFGLKGGSGHGCFSGDMTVVTPSGTKRLEELNVGDQVEVLTSETKKFQPIEWFYHKDRDHVMDFFYLSTRSGYNISVTGNHLIPFVPCVNETISLQAFDELTLKSSVFAFKARVGSCLAIRIGNSFRPDRIISVQKFRKAGIFSPITSAGTIVVNGIQASCYSSVENQALQRTVHSVLIKIDRLVQSIVALFNGCHYKADKKSMEDKGVPNVLKFLLDISRLLLPTRTYG